MDKEGRVIRFDSFSKIISSGIPTILIFFRQIPGLRLGFVTGPKTLVELIQYDQQATCLHTSGLSQVVLYSVLSKWGKEGWDKQMQAVQKTYTERRDLLLQYAEKHLTGLAEWHTPSAGWKVYLYVLIKKECLCGSS
jgi:kynurenine/2-aminoadipate aminotransferase